MNKQNTVPDFGEPWDIQDGYAFDRTGLEAGKGQISGRLQRSVTCVNACAGMTDPAAEITAMREAIKEAHEALKELRSFYIEMTNLPPCAANAALAKLKLFLND